MSCVYHLLSVRGKFGLVPALFCSFCFRSLRCPLLPAQQARWHKGFLFLVPPPHDLFGVALGGSMHNGMSLAVSGWPWLIPDTRWLWLALADSRHKVALAGSRHKVTLGGSGWFQKQGGSGWLWQVPDTRWLWLATGWL